LEAMLMERGSKDANTKDLVDRRQVCQFICRRRRGQRTAVGIVEE